MLQKTVVNPVRSRIAALENLLASPQRRDFIFLVGDRLLRLSASLVLSGLIARHLGVEAFGWFNYAGVVLTIGTSIALLGMDNIVVREAAKYPEKTADIMGTAFILRIGVGLLLVALTWILLPFVAGEDRTQRRLVGILALGMLMPALGVPTLWFQSRTESRFAVRAGLSIFVALVLLRLWLLWENAAVTAFAWANLVEGAANGAVLAIAMFKRGGRMKLDHFGLHARTIMIESWPLLIGALAAMLYMRMDQLMIRWLVGADGVGIYAVATRISDVAYSFPVLAGTSIAATLANISGDATRFEAAVEKYFRASSAFAYICLVPAIILAPWVLRAIFGVAYSAAGAVAQIHLLTFFFVCMGVARGRVLIVEGLVRFAMFTALSGSAINLLLNFLLIPKYGLHGAAWAAVAGHGMASVGSTLLYRPTRQLGYRQIRAIFRPMIVLSR